MTYRLSVMAFDQWESIDGYAVGHNIDIWELPFERFCNFIWWLFTRNGSEQDIDKFRSKLWQPPKGVVPPKESPWSAEAETAAFGALRQQLGVTGTQ